ncbi:hypothetical protein [Paenibacillus sp. SYP-B4298]|nr:hypothetical protein [Paenibacillus sp. SYP-B4298]
MDESDSGGRVDGRVDIGQTETEALHHEAGASIFFNNQIDS